MEHAGLENGQLVVTYADFSKFGIRRSSIAEALRDLEAAGLVEVTLRGRGGNAEYRQESRYRLTYLAAKGKAAATDEWKKRPSPPEI